MRVPRAFDDGYAGGWGVVERPSGARSRVCCYAELESPEADLTSLMVLRAFLVASGAAGCLSGSSRRPSCSGAPRNPRPCRCRAALGERLSAGVAGGAGPQRGGHPRGCRRARLADDYPRLEVILVDNRSTGATPAVVDRLAARHRNVRALHLTALPEGWLGKLNAMDQGARLARGEWLLFSDADVHFAATTLRRSITWAEARGLDHLSVFPGIVCKSFWVSAVVSAFARVILTFGRVWGIEDPKSTAFMGIGAFNLVRRSAWEKAKGFDWLQAGTGRRHGRRLAHEGERLPVGVISGTRAVTVEWYPTLAAMIVGAERAAFSLCDYRLIWVAIAAFSILLLELGPLIALLPLGVAGLRFMGLGALAAAWVCSLSVNRWVGLRPLPAFFVFGGALLHVWMLVRAGVLGTWRGGLVWRGTSTPSRNSGRGAGSNSDDPPAVGVGVAGPT